MRARFAFRVCLFVGAMAWLTPASLRASPGISLHADSGIESPRLPASLCGLVTGQIICYDSSAAGHPITPAGRQVTDFAIAPDGNWIVYRSSDTVTITAIYGATLTRQVDGKATPPAALDLSAATIAWSPNGLAIAYVTAGGFRVAFPTPSGQPRFVEVNNRLAVNLRFSTGGGRLAVQAADGTWSLFAIQAGDDSSAVQYTRSVDQAADVAWLNDDDLVVAAVAGGLSRISAASAGDKAPAWTLPDEHFTKLITTSTGEVLALHPDPGDTIGSVVSISADGRITPLGTSKIDAMAEWGPDGRTLYYITSGTPILIDRATGAEDTLPLSRVLRLAWLPPLPLLSSSAPLDADLYFLAPDNNGVRQVWWLPRSGLDAVIQLSHETDDVRDFVASRTDVILKTDRQNVLVPLVGTEVANAAIVLPTRTPSPLAVSADTEGWVITRSSQVVVKSPWPILDEQAASSVKSGSSLLFIRRIGWTPGPDTIQLCRSTPNPALSEIRSRAYVFSNAVLSPTGRFVAGWQRTGTIGQVGQLVILDLESGRKLRIQGTRDISSLQWAM